MSDELVVLRGGVRDGESTTVQDGVRRLVAASDAPGLVEIYEANGQTAEVGGNPEAALVFVHVGQEAAGDLAPELQHSPQSGP
ncbi:MAG: hypothetical protein AVDCRST_MAG16-1702 [uncultured Frankineae bacterium]|uniref:Uncharacterized protein n=1 Tax=uncultured Frankineae bacterium TaxID=437475 RepID=A0A6J4LS96_9ACTN|nr:MAG: hypothetical protein AVDCRST_MAG16-1702 [uncultured Frankineae bacterium]